MCIWHMETYDIAVIGGGIVGLAAAYQLSLSLPNKRLILIEKETDIGQHQSSHNSGVLHSGIYYKPGSAKALNCREGIALMRDFSEKNHIPFKICGKTIIATTNDHIEQLQGLHQRGLSNGIKCRLLTVPELKEREPHVRALAALLVEETGVISYGDVCRAIRAILDESGCEILCGAKVKSGTETNSEVIIRTNLTEIRASHYIAAAGLYSDKLLASFGHSPPCKIIPFRGEYFVLKKDRSFLCRSLIYPVPNPLFPFLGVHFTRGINDEVECGPNAVLAFAREGYKKLSFNPSEAFESLGFPGLSRFLLSHWREALFELTRSCSKRLFLAGLQQLIPEVALDDLENGPAGVRAQAMLPNGKLVDDFLWFDTARGIHVLNAPSPAATSAFSIGKTITDRLVSRMG